MQNKELDLGYAEQNIRFAKGNDRSFNLAFTNKSTGAPRDLTGYVFTAGLIGITGGDFTVSNDAPSTGIITVTVPASVTTPLQLKGNYRWYLDYTFATKLRSLMKGAFKLV